MKNMNSEGSELYAEYTTTWIALFHMTLGEYEAQNVQEVLSNFSSMLTAVCPRSLDPFYIVIVTI